MVTNRELIIINICYIYTFYLLIFIACDKLVQHGNVFVFSFISVYQLVTQTSFPHIDIVKLGDSPTTERE